jgi:hypothetical protein
MKKISLILVLALCMGLVNAQEVKFNQYFALKTLRIDYRHSGNLKTDTIEFSKAHYYANWAGTMSQLIDPFNFGANRVELYDSASNTMIYSRGYSNLFEEWRTTAEGKIKTESFEETLLVPMPKKTVKVAIQRRERDGKYSLLSAFYLNPSNIELSTVAKAKQMVLHRGGKSDKCMDLTFIADGYAISDSTKLKEDFQRFAGYYLNCKPYNKLKRAINIIGVLSYSEESGITDPISSTQRKSAVGCTFNSIGSDRYLMTTQMWKLHDCVESAPTDAIVIICNTPKYGGGGIYNYYATVAAGCAQGNFILVHETGHSIAGLGDEYYTSEVSTEDFYPLNIEPWEPNITTNVDFGKKWKWMIAKETPVPTPCESKYENTVGLYEGAGYMAKGIYRPWQNCTMKEIKYDGFCPVCQNAILRMVEYYRGIYKK